MLLHNITRKITHTNWGNQCGNEVTFHTSWILPKLKEQCGGLLITDSQIFTIHFKRPKVSAEIGPLMHLCMFTWGKHSQTPSKIDMVSLGISHLKSSRLLQ